MLYDVDGVRYKKTHYDNGTTITHNYICEGTKILSEEILGVSHAGKLNYLYIGNQIIGFTYKNKQYYYQKNLQGDIIRIYDTSNNLVAYYQYDAWGNHRVYNPTGTINTSDSFIGNINPFRYRGYYYDRESNLYYCNARYYNPELCRWMSLDSIEYAEPDRLNGCNLYAYCNNNPVNYSDGSGHIAISALIIGAILGSVIGFGVSAATDYVDDGQMFNGSVTFGEYIGTTLLGGIVGGLGGAAITGSSLMLSGIAGGAAGSYVNTSMTQIMNKDVNLGALYTQTIAGGIMGALGTMNITNKVAYMKMVVSGLSNAITSFCYGKSGIESILDGLSSAALSGAITTASYFASSIINSSPTVISTYQDQFIFRFISFFKNFI